MWVRSVVASTMALLSARGAPSPRPKQRRLAVPPLAALLALALLALLVQEVRLNALRARLEAAVLLASQQSIAKAGELAAAAAGGAAAGKGGAAGLSDEASLSINEELDAVYKQLTDQAAEIEALRKARARSESTGAAALPRAALREVGQGAAGEVSYSFEGWTFYPGLDFDGGDIEGLGDKSSLKDDVPMLVAEASAIERCVAFNTNGWLKSDVPPRSRWKRWTNDPAKGLFVRADLAIRARPDR